MTSATFQKAASIMFDASYLKKEVPLNTPETRMQAIIELATFAFGDSFQAGQFMGKLNKHGTITPAMLVQESLSGYNNVRNFLVRYADYEHGADLSLAAQEVFAELVEDKKLAEIDSECDQIWSKYEETEIALETYLFVKKAIQENKDIYTQKEDIYYDEPEAVAA